MEDYLDIEIDVEDVIRGGVLKGYKATVYVNGDIIYKLTQPSYIESKVSYYNRVYSVAQTLIYSRVSVYRETNRYTRPGESSGLEVVEESGVVEE